MPPRARTVLVRCLMALALIYAFLAGLRTVTRADLGWQLATGRYISQNHSIPSTDVFSHTARGHEWIYPPLSSLVLYAVERIGGFAALSWLGAMFCVLTLVVLLRRVSIAAIVLAVIAVPILAARVAPRAEMFTVVLFAAFAAILWRQHCDGNARLWLLPLLMFFWVNLHPGFIAGLALIVAYILIEFGDASAADASPIPRLQRVRKALPWFAATFVVTLLNPFGWSIYRAIAEQERAMAQHAVWFGEWTPIRLTTASLRQGLWLRDPQSAIYWLLLAALLATVLYIGERRFGSALVLATGGWLTIQHNRYDALLACLVVVIAAPAYSEAIRRFGKRDDSRERASMAPSVIVLALVLMFAGLRSFDLVTNRAYLRSLGGSAFGAGLSSTYPRAAADFIVEHHLPREILNDYSNGGYWVWALGPEYPDYVDGRALPFGPEIIQRSEELLGRISPDSPAWEEESRIHGVQTVAVGLGTSNFTMLPAFCRSQNWTPVYLDAWGAVLVRRRPENAAFDNLRVDCGSVPIVAAHAADSRSRAERFYALVSGARILQLLERNQEALDRLNEAQTIFAGNADLEMQRGIVLYGLRRVEEAERALRQSVEMRPSAQNCAILGQFYAMQKRPHSAITAFRCAAALAPYPARTYITIAQMHLQANDPKAALAELDRAWRHADEAGPDQINRFRADVSEFRGRAYWAMQDSTAAVNAMRQATELDAGNPSRWEHLADLYDAMNRPNEAAQARERAQQLTH